jgi:hypothetical protein
MLIRRQARRGCTVVSVARDEFRLPLSSGRRDIAGLLCWVHIPTRGQASADR